MGRGVPGRLELPAGQPKELWRDSRLWRGLGESTGDWGEAGEGLAAGDGAVGDLAGVGGEGADAGGVGEEVGEGVDRVFVGGEGDDRLALVRAQDFADAGGAGVVGVWDLVEVVE